MSVPMLPLVDVSRQHATLEAELKEAFARVVASSRFILGMEVERFQEELAEYVGVDHAVGVASGTDALVLALQAAGVGPGDEVITTPFSFFASVGCILRLGAVPRFADIEREGFNLDPSRVEALVGERTRAVVCVHLFGEPAAAAQLRLLCERHGLCLIEDGAQALSAQEAGRQVGSIGHVGCFSFFPSKPLGGLGDGGMITTSDPELARRCRLLRAHGASVPHRHEILGGNHRLDALQAAFLRVKLPYLERWRAAREHHSRGYDTMLLSNPKLIASKRRSDVRSAHAHYTLRLAPRVADREQVRRALALAGVESAVYYERPLYAQAVPELQRTLTGSEALACPNAEARCREVLSVPLFPEMTTEERERVVAAVKVGLA